MTLPIPKADGNSALNALTKEPWSDVMTITSTEVKGRVNFARTVTSHLHGRIKQDIAISVCLQITDMVRIVLLGRVVLKKIKMAIYSFTILSHIQGDL